VDAISHALIVTIILLALGLPALIPFAVIGSVILDADILFSFISDRSPDLYLFTHGGIAHSIVGAVVLSALAYLCIIGISMAGVIPIVLDPGSGIVAFTVILAGAFLHLLIDLLACPGIPILAPFSESKFTPGILPGPSILLMGSAIVVVVFIISGRVPVLVTLAVYSIVVILYLSFRTAAFLYAAAILPGRRVPTINPFRWLVITANDSEYLVRYYTAFSGFSHGEALKKYSNTNPGELKHYFIMPEVLRVVFNSYITIAERNGATLIISDPLREKGYIYYPPKFKRVEIPVAGVS
jgi:inner membrane protein